MAFIDLMLEGQNLTALTFPTALLVALAIDHYMGEPSARAPGGLDG